MELAPIAEVQPSFARFCVQKYEKKTITATFSSFSFVPVSLPAFLSTKSVTPQERKSLLEHYHIGQLQEIVVRPENYRFTCNLSLERTKKNKFSLVLCSLVRNFALVIVSKSIEA